MKRSHIWHLVDPSPWPIISALNSINFIIGLILFIHGKTIGFPLFLWAFSWQIMFINWWFDDIIAEATFEGKHTSLVQKGLTLGMILFIVSEVCFFFGFFWAYFHFSLSPAIEIGCRWPPYGIQVFNYFQVPLFNTFVLLLSGVCVTWTHNEVCAKNIENKFNTYLSLILSLILAVFFTYLQITEYITASFHIGDSAYGSIFFMATGFHGFHVILGTLYLFNSFRRLVQFHFKRDHHLGLEFAIWYWHFVDVVWLFLFVSVYWWSYKSVGLI